MNPSDYPRYSERQALPGETSLKQRTSMQPRPQLERLYRSGKTLHLSFLLCIFASALAPSAQAQPVNLVCNPSTGPTKVGVAYSSTCTVSGGVAPYTFSYTALPGGLGIAQTGATTAVVSGTPTTAGAFNYTVYGRDASNPLQQASVTFSGTIAPAVSPVSFVCNPSTGPTKVGVPYSSTCTVSGGVAPYTFSYTALPSGLGIAQTGATTAVVSGTPTTAGAFNYTVYGRDGSNPLQQASVTFSGTIAPAVSPVSFVCNPSTGPTKVGVPYSSTCTVSGGVAPYTFSYTALPNGLGVAQTGATTAVISGTPTTAGAFNYTVYGRDGSNPLQQASVTFTGTIAPAASAVSLVCNPSTGPTTVGVAYSSTCTVSGGVAPYTFSYTALPNGLSIAQTGATTAVVSGTPTTAGPFNYLVYGRDGSNPLQQASVTFNGTIVAPGSPSLIITKTHVGNFTQGQAGTYTITVTNVGTAATAAGPIAQILDTLPAGLTASSVQGDGWLCTTGPPVGCNRGDSLAPGASYPSILLTVNVAPNAPASVINTVSLSGAGNAVANDPTTIVAAGGSLSISGAVLDARGTCSAGVSLTATGGNATQTIADGTYTFSNLLPGSYTITPSKATCTFAPTSITLNLTSSVNGINFTGGGGAGITIAPATLRPATLGAPYSALLTATGGTAPHTFTVVAGSLPAGLSLATNGAMSGTPSQLLAFPSTFTVQARDANGANGQLAYTLDVVAASSITITGIRSASDFGGGFAFFASGSWIEIVGTGLATSTRTWDGSDFTGGGLVAPTVLDNVRVFINNQPAFVYFVSPTQLNVQAPADSASGPVEVRVTNAVGVASFAFQKRLNAPGMLAPSAFNVGGRQYLAAQFPDRSFVGRANLIQGAAFRPAKPGDPITLYGIGFGEVSPGGSPGNVVTAANNVVSPVTIAFGQTPATVSYSGLAPGFLGLYQFNVTVPEVPDGDSQINITLGGQPLLQPAMFLTVQRP